MVGIHSIPGPERRRARNRIEARRVMNEVMKEEEREDRKKSEAKEEEIRIYLESGLWDMECEEVKCKGDE